MLLAKGRVPVVLDGVVAAAKEDVSDFSPSILNGLVENVEYPVFFNRPICFLEERIQLVVPALTALLAGATFHLKSHVFPLVGTDLSDHVEKLQVLHVVPGAFA